MIVQGYRWSGGNSVFIECILRGGVFWRLNHPSPLSGWCFINISLSSDSTQTSVSCDAWQVTPTYKPWAQYTVRISKHYTFGATHLAARGARAPFFWWCNDIFTNLFFFEKSCQSTQIHIHLNRDLDSVSSSTDNMKRLGPIPSSWCIPAPCMYPRRAAASSSGESTSRSMKPAALNSLHLIMCK